MYLPALDDEITGIANYLDQQLVAIRVSAAGLTAEQAAATPCRSTLSVGGIIKHVLYGMRGAITRLNEGVPATFDPSAMDVYGASFALDGTESLTELLADFDAAQAELRTAVLSLDPHAEALESAAPWQGIFDQRPIRQRYYLQHLLEEFARHAGHADIIREQLDGVSIAALKMTKDGTTASEYFQPYEPAPGTIPLG